MVVLHLSLNSHFASPREAQGLGFKLNLVPPSATPFVNTSMA